MRGLQEKIEIALWLTALIGMFGLIFYFIVVYGFG